MADEKKVALKGDVPESLRNKFKSLCAINNITMSEVLEDIVRKWINSHENMGHENTDDSGITAESFLKMLADNKRPTAIQRAILADTLDIPVEVLDRVIECLFDKKGVENGI
jgi:hypothetical protein